MNDKKQVSIYLTQEQHRALKQIALNKDTSQTALVEKAVEELIKKELRQK